MVMHVNGSNDVAYQNKIKQNKNKIERNYNEI